MPPRLRDGALLEAIGDAVVAIDAHGLVTYWGPGAEALYGRPAAEVLGRPLADVYTYRWERPEEEQRAWVALEREGRWRGRNVHVLASGDERRVESTVAVLRDDRGVRIGLLALIRDETERVEAERAANEKLLEADRRKDQFLAVVSHELRNPLGAIRNALFLLDRAPDGSDSARRARTIVQRQTEHLARLVDDLLDVARITGGKVELRRSLVDVREVVRRCLDDHAPSYEQRGVALLKAVAEPVWVHADGARLTQMIGNLLQNALKFTPPGGRVEVAVQARGGACAISVRDTGVGITAEDLARIFTRFAQAERTRRQSQGGLGIGLSLVRELAALHGGSVRASSPGAGQGAEFVIELPLAAPADREPARAAPDPSPALSILVVEDNEDEAATLADVLALMGHRVRTAASGRAALDAAAAEAPDVIICDVGLPDRSGHEVMRALRATAAGRDVFAVAVTGYAQPQDVDDALRAGFDAHLPKPPPLEELRSLLAGAARQRAAGGRTDPAP